MPTLRRILKYTPAVVFGLLVVAWVVSVIRQAGICLVPLRLGHISVQSSQVRIDIDPESGCDHAWTCFFEKGGRDRPMRLDRLLGQDIRFQHWPGIQVFVGLPMPLIVTALLALAIGPFISFRFRLWHYLAYTALVAVELAYYLR